MAEDRVHTSASSEQMSSLLCNELTRVKTGSGLLLYSAERGIFGASPSSLASLPCGAGMVPGLSWVEDRM